jgi:hypothetical protein
VTTTPISAIVPTEAMSIHGLVMNTPANEDQVPSP